MITCAQAKLIIVGNPTTLATLDKLWRSFLHDIEYSRGWFQGVPARLDQDLESVDVYTESSITRDEDDVDDNGEEGVQVETSTSEDSDPGPFVTKDGKEFVWKTGQVANGLISDIKVFLDKSIPSIPVQR